MHFPAQLVDASVLKTSGGCTYSKVHRFCRRVGRFCNFYLHRWLRVALRCPSEEIAVDHWWPTDGPSMGLPCTPLHRLNLAASQFAKQDTGLTLGYFPSFVRKAF